PLEGGVALGGARVAVAAARECGGYRAAGGARGGTPADARERRGRTWDAPPLPPRRPRVPPVRRDRPLVRTGRGRADGVLVSRLPERRPRARVVGKQLRCDRRSSTTRCAASASAPSPSSTAISTPA